MRFKITGILLLSAVVLTSSAAAQTTPAPSAITRTAIAATKLPSVTDVPLYFRAVGDLRDGPYPTNTPASVNSGIEENADSRCRTFA